MTAAAPGLFEEPERVEIPDRIPLSWTAGQFRAGLVSSVKIGDWEAAYRVVCAMVERGQLGQRGPLRQMVCVVLDLHEPLRMYKDCGHLHEEDDNGEVPDGVFWLEGSESYVCESGYRTTVCRACEFGVDGNCLPDGSWPCPTFRPMAERLVEALGVVR